MSSDLPHGRYRPSPNRSPILPRHLKRSILPTCRRRIFRPQEVGISDVQRSRKPTQVIIIKTILNLVILIHPSIPLPPAQDGWRWIDTISEKKSNVKLIMTFSESNTPMTM